MEFDVNRAIKYFQDVISLRYADFNGRVTRKDYWTYAAVVFGIFIVAQILQGIVGLGIGAAMQLLLLLPSAAITARRLQDTGHPGSLTWILFLPILFSSLISFMKTITFGMFGLIMFFLPWQWVIDLIAVAALIYIVYLCIQPGMAGSNQYGSEPASVS